MMDTQEFLTRVRRRSTGSVLGYMEKQPWYGALNAEQRRGLRDKVLSAEGAYHDAVLDVIKTLDGNGGVHNDKALELLAELHETLVQQRPFVPTDAAADGG